MATNGLEHGLLFVFFPQFSGFPSVNYFLIKQAAWYCCNRFTYTFKKNLIDTFFHYPPKC